MSPFEIVRLLVGAGTRFSDGGRWQASHKVNGKQTKERPRVTRFVCGLSEEEGAWLEFEFEEEDGPHKLRGTFAVDNRDELVRYDDRDVEEDDVIVSHRFCGLGLRGVLEFEFVLAQDTHRYRFDATLMRAV
ncbi:MAG TPA: hypothetical protein VGE01_04615 [Fimbriimonas sp.]